MASLKQAQNIEDLALLARKRLPHGLFEFIDRGAEDEITMRENARDLKRVMIRQRVGIDVSVRDISTTLFGVRQSMPIAVGVTGATALLAYRGEHKLARAAAAAGVPYTIGTANFAPISELKAICGDLLWRQIYPPKRRAMVDHHIKIARDGGIRVLVLTLDAPLPGNREYLRRSGFHPRIQNWRTVLGSLSAPYWLFGTLGRYMLSGGLPEMADMPEGCRDFFSDDPETRASQAHADDFTWDDVTALRRKWSDVLVVKGISTPEDARIAAACGVDGIIVSNHGGRSLDGCVSSIGVLPQIIDAVAPKVTVMVDGGFRRGADVLKAIAMGASSVMIGRSTLLGLTAAGEPGARKALQIFRDEIDRALALCGCRDLSNLSREFLAY